MSRADALTDDPLIASLAGHVDVETGDGVRPWRLTAASRRHAPETLRLMAEFTSGVRLRLLTDADELELELSAVRIAPRNLGAPRAAARFVAVAEGADPVIADLEETAVVTETADRRLERGPALRASIRIPLGAADRERAVELWLPHDAGVALHALRAARAGSPTGARPAPATGRPRWLHHGSSISHGGNASSPLATWPARAAAELGLDVVNLGFGGNAQLDPMTARTIAATPADVVTIKLGINVVGGDTMRERTFVPAVHGFLDLVREGHPGTPVVLLTAIGCAPVEHAPGPLRAGADGRVEAVPREVAPGDGSLSLARSRELLAAVVEERRPEDPALFLGDGLALLGVEEGGELMPDGLHPDDEGYALMATRFAALARDPSTGLGAAFAPVLAGLTPRA